MSIQRLLTAFKVGPGSAWGSDLPSTARRFGYVALIGMLVSCSPSISSVTPPRQPTAPEPKVTALPTVTKDPSDSATSTPLRVPTQPQPILTKSVEEDLSRCVLEETGSGPQLVPPEGFALPNEEVLIVHRTGKLGSEYEMLLPDGSLAPFRVRSTGGEDTTIQAISYDHRFLLYFDRRIDDDSAVYGIADNTGVNTTEFIVGASPEQGVIWPQLDQFAVFTRPTSILDTHLAIDSIFDGTRGETREGRGLSISWRLFAFSPDMAHVISIDENGKLQLSDIDLGEHVDLEPWATDQTIDLMHGAAVRWTTQGVSIAALTAQGLEVAQNQSLKAVNATETAVQRYSLPNPADSWWLNWSSIIDTSTLLAVRRQFNGPGDMYAIELERGMQWPYCLDSEVLPRQWLSSAGGEVVVWALPSNESATLMLDISSGARYIVRDVTPVGWVHR